MYSNPRQWADIRRRVLVMGESIGSVTRSKRMSRNTVKKILRLDTPPGYDNSKRGTLSKVAKQIVTSKLIKLSPESEWNTWLAEVEQGRNKPEVVGVYDGQLAQMLWPKPARLRTKALTVLAHGKGFSQNKISTFLGISVNTVKKYLDAYRSSGAAGLIARAPREKSAMTHIFASPSSGCFMSRRH